MGLRHLAGLLAGLSVLFVLLPAAATASRLAVEVSGLPAAVGAKVLVEGPGGFHRRVGHSRTLDGVPSGRYTVRLEPVTISRARAAIPAGSKAFPVRRRLRVHVGPGKKATAEAAYGTIRGADVETLAGPILAVIGDPRSPRGIVVPSSRAAGVGTGSILAAAPRGLLSSGLFARVTGKEERADGKVVLSLRAASLWDAFPALDLERTVTLGESALPEGAAGASALSAVDLGFGGAAIQKKLATSCGATPDGWSLAPSGSLEPALEIDIHRRYQAVPTGELSLGVRGHLGLDATIPTGTRCNFTLPGPDLRGWVAVDGIPVPVEGGVDLSVSIQTSAPIKTQAYLALDATGGMRFVGTSVAPIADFSPTASGSVDGTGGEIDIVPDLRANIGPLDEDAHVAVSPGLALKGSASGCELDLKGSAGAGIDGGDFRPSVESPAISRPLYRCPGHPQGAGSGGGAAATPTSGGEPTAPGGGGAPVEEKPAAEGVGPVEWRAEPYPDPVPGFLPVSLADTACTGSGLCVGVGYSGPEPGDRQAEIVTVTTDHRASLLAPLPPDASPSAYSYFQHVSCATGEVCVATGVYTNTSGKRAGFVETLQDGQWTATSLPVPPGGKAGTAAVYSAGCAGAGFCAVGGLYENATNGLTLPLAATYDGTGWSVERVPDPHGSGERGGISAISCWQEGGCVAVGSDSFGDKAMISTLAPQGWTSIEAPSPAGTDSKLTLLNHLSCASATLCAADGQMTVAGEYVGGLLETFDGERWTASIAPYPADATPGSVSVVNSTAKGISCSGSTCTFGGFYSTGGQSPHPEALVDSFEDGSWTMRQLDFPDALPASSAQAKSQTTSVTCTAFEECIATGTYADTAPATAPFLFTARGQAAATIEAPLPSDAVSSGGFAGEVTEVSCTGDARLCIAFGRYGTSAGVQYTLEVRVPATPSAG